MAFYLPLLRHIPISAHAIMATAHNMLRKLDSGRSLILCPGGIAELMLSNSQEERICASHKGLVCAATWS